LSFGRRVDRYVFRRHCDHLLLMGEYLSGRLDPDFQRD
jgi:hypothetical protein